MEFSYSFSFKPEKGPDFIAIAPAFMSAIMFWNHAETTIRQIVQLLLGQSAISIAVAAEMGNRSLVQAIKTATHEVELANLAPHLKHLCTGYERLLSYRNFYVHGIYATEATTTGTVIRVLSIDGKNQVRLFTPVITKADLEGYTANVHRLIGYGVAIQKELGATGDGLDRMIASYQASLEKPEWLPELEKVPQYLQAPVPPPPTFPA